jgi:hypothetical protein
MTHDPTAPFRPVIADQAALEDAWRRLMSPLGFGRTSVWLMLVGDDDRPVPQLTEVEGCERPLTPGELDGLAEAARLLLDDLAPTGRLALLLSRPGPALPRPADLALARGVLQACRAHGVPTEVVHLATDTDVVPLPYDTLALPAA